MRLFLVFAMIFCHVVDDYYQQGILARLKQKEWWQQNAPAELYKNDYIVALFTHAFSWAFMILIPLIIYSATHIIRESFWYIFCPLFIILNTYVHARVDNAKANEHTINLIIDQTIHVGQVLFTYVLFIVFY